MNNHEPSRREIITAHVALETLTDTCIYSSEQAEELQEMVLRSLPPKPRLTMAEVEWDDDLHYLAEAEHKDYGRVIMLGDASYNPDLIECLVPHFEDRAGRLNKRSITPTGKRYTLTEVQE